MKRSRVSELLRAIQGTTIGVLGDFCLDCYWELDREVSEISIETGRPTRAVTAQRYTPGGAGNVSTNLIALGVGNVHAFGVMGDDLFGRELSRLLGESNVSPGGFVVQRGGWDTPVYAKPYVAEEEQERIDFGRFNRISEQTVDLIISALTEAIPALDALIINQQLEHGIWTARLIEALNSYALGNPEKVFLLDSRDHRLKFTNMIRKLNIAEAARLCGDLSPHTSPYSSDRIRTFGRQISEQSGRPVFITRSDQGGMAFEKSCCWEIQGIRFEGPVDPVGAGDTAVAAIAASLAAGGNVEEAAYLANLAAAVTVRKLKQTGTASPEEILGILALSEAKT